MSVCGVQEPERNSCDASQIGSPSKPVAGIAFSTAVFNNKWFVDTRNELNNQLPQSFGDGLDTAIYLGGENEVK